MHEDNYGFFGSRLNTVLLFVLIILMVFALRFMYQNKEWYFNQSAQPNTVVPVRQQNIVSLASKDKVAAVSLGDIVSITLGNPGDGGYSFEAPIYDKSMFVLKDTFHTNPGANPAPGNWGTDTWEFVSFKKGTSKIEINAIQGLSQKSRENMFTATITTK